MSRRHMGAVAAKARPPASAAIWTTASAGFTATDPTAAPPPRGAAPARKPGADATAGPGAKADSGGIHPLARPHGPSTAFCAAIGDLQTTRNNARRAHLQGLDFRIGSIHPRCIRLMPEPDRRSGTTIIDEWHMKTIFSRERRPGPVCALLLKQG